MQRTMFKRKLKNRFRFFSKFYFKNKFFFIRLKNNNLKTELSQKLEDSKKNIPEWKKNLIKQKEMKKISTHNQYQVSFQ
jgi:hypothetical protein